MRRELRFKAKKDVIISNKRLDKNEFITESLFCFSKKNEYEIHLLEKLLETNKETNKLLRKFVDKDKDK
jgi:hypothetical protein